MKKIPLTKGYEVKVSDSDYSKVKAMCPWYADIRPDGSAVAKKMLPSRKVIVMHRFLLGILDSPEIDVRHLDGDKLNNQRENLVTMTRSETNATARKRSGASSRFKGVSKDTSITGSRAWIAKIYIKGEQVFLGYFRTQIEAAQAYNEAAKKEYGSLAKLNEIKTIIASTRKKK
jgi:hypothetical protein